MDFIQTLRTYRRKWEELDAAGIVAHFAPEYHGSYAHALERVDVSILETALAGWRDAFDQLRHASCKWEFADLAIRPVGANGMLVIGWLRLHVNGNPAGETYRMEVWRQDRGEWRLLRDHQEYNVLPADFATELRL
jgi:ketosteroid isomerase-like protein